MSACRSLPSIIARSRGRLVEKYSCAELASLFGRPFLLAFKGTWSSATQSGSHSHTDTRPCETAASMQKTTTTRVQRKHKEASVRCTRVSFPASMGELQAVDTRSSSTSSSSSLSCLSSLCSSNSASSKRSRVPHAMTYRNSVASSCHSHTGRRAFSTNRSGDVPDDHVQPASAAEWKQEDHDTSIEEDEDQPDTALDAEEELAEEVARTLPDFREVGDFDASEMSPEDLQEVWQQGTQLLEQFKQHLVERLKVERAQVISAATGISEDEAASMEGMQVAITDDEARRVLRYALGSRITHTHDKLIGALGTLDPQALWTAVEMLVQMAEASLGCLWQLQVADLLEPDAQARFFRSMLLWKLATDSPEGAARGAEGVAAVGPEATHAAMLEVEKRINEGTAGGRGKGEEVLVDDATLARSFVLFQDTVGNVTLQEFGAMEELLVRTSEAGEQMTYHDIISPEGPARLMRGMLSQLMHDLSDDTRARMLRMLREDVEAHQASLQSTYPDDDPTHPDTMLLFLSDNMPVIAGCTDEHRDDVVSGLLDTYELQSQPVTREFIPPAPGELPPEVAHSPMKPLSQEISHRVKMLVNLFPPQRVAWGAYVDLTKVVRPMRAKNLMKRFKYDNPVPNQEVW